MNREPTRAGRAGERGAALVTALLISLLMLAAGCALIYTTGMSAVNAVDATAEVQAYYAAEAGLQSALSVARGNVAKQAGLSLPAGTKVRNNFRALNQLSTANLPGDTSTESRLSGWLPYVGGRVSLGNNVSFELSVSDPDDLNRVRLAADASYIPSRLLITSTGYGPKGAVKRMRLLVDRHYFDFTPQATLLMRGAEDCSNLAGFSIGQSNAKEYSGNDAGTPPLPPLPVFGTTCAGNNTQVTGVVDGSKPNTVTDSPKGKVATLTSSDLPPWLQSANDARALLLDLQARAGALGRYFKSQPDDFGSAANPQLTFVDGDCDLKDGAGLLVVTGKLTMKGNANFKGLILVLGEGEMSRNGGGNGDIMGAIVVAKFARTWPASENNQPHPFLAPVFDTNGGGNSTVQYNSSNISDAMGSLGNRLLGVQEY